MLKKLMTLFFNACDVTFVKSATKNFL